MNLRTALSLETMQLDVKAVEEALLPPPTPAQTGLVMGDASTTQAVWEDVSLNETIDAAAAKGDEVTDLQTAMSEVGDVVTAIESMHAIRMEKRALTIAIESILTTHRVDGLFAKHFGSVGLESIGAMSDAEYDVAVEGLVGDLLKGIQNIGVRASKAFGDWWYYEAAVMRKIADKANQSLIELKRLKGATATKETISVTDLHALQCEGKTTAKDIIAGFNNLLKTEETLNDSLPKFFGDYVKEILAVYKSTASSSDTTVRRILLVTQVLAVITASSALITFIPAVQAGGAIATSVISAIGNGIANAVGANADVVRQPALQTVISKTSKAFQTYIKQVSTLTTLKPMSGDRRLQVGYSQHDNSIVEIGFTKNYEARSDSKQTVVTPTLNELETMLKAIVDGAEAFQHRNYAYDKVRELYYSVLGEMFAGADKDQSNAIQRGATKLSYLLDVLYVEPTITIGKLHASAARSLLDYCQRGMAAYR